MTKEEMLIIMRLLAALESVMLVNKAAIPDYLLDQCSQAVSILEREILK